MGYKVHLSETCEPTTPHLLTEVLTTPASTPDEGQLDDVHRQMEERGRLPREHLVDSGYVVAELLVRSQARYGVQVIGPSRANQQWQARQQTGYDASQFVLDWTAEQARCPQGCTSRSWKAAADHGRLPVIKISFAARDCRPCPARAQCTRAQRRTLTVRSQAAWQAQAVQRAQEQTADFAAAYAQRAGIEGTISQGVRRTGLRQARYRGEAKVALQHLLSAAALNLARMEAWLAGHAPLPPRRSALTRLLVA